MKTGVTNKNLIYPELSYALNGIFFKVHNDLGRFCNEKQYSDAVEMLLQKKNISHKREHILPISFNGERGGRNIVDFLIEDKIIVEIKAKTHLEKSDYYQTLRYLAALQCELGLLVNFRRYYMVPKRILNHELYSGFSDK